MQKFWLTDLNTTPLEEIESAPSRQLVSGVCAKEREEEEEAWGGLNWDFIHSAFNARRSDRDKGRVMREREREREAAAGAN
jgi:hypothetical protein